MYGGALARAFNPPGPTGWFPPTLTHVPLPSTFPPAVRRRDISIALRSAQLRRNGDRRRSERLTAEGVGLDVEGSEGVGSDVVLDSPRGMTSDGDGIPLGFVDDVNLVRLPQEYLYNNRAQSVLHCNSGRLLLREREAVDPRCWEGCYFESTGVSVISAQDLREALVEIRRGRRRPKVENELGDSTPCCEFQLKTSGGTAESFRKSWRVARDFVGETGSAPDESKDPAGDDRDSTNSRSSDALFRSTTRTGKEKRNTNLLSAHTRISDNFISIVARGSPRAGREEREGEEGVRGGPHRPVELEKVLGETRNSTRFFRNANWNHHGNTFLASRVSLRRAEGNPTRIKEIDRYSCFPSEKRRAQILAVAASAAFSSPILPESTSLPISSLMTTFENAVSNGNRREKGLPRNND